MNILFKTFIFTLALIISPVMASAETLKTINLPDPQLQFAKNNDSFHNALKNRATFREYSSKKLDLNHLSAILWAAYGKNRDNDNRTIPLASAKKGMIIYVLDTEGVWLYDPIKNTLTQQSTKDIREKSHRSSNSPMSLVYAFDKTVTNKETTAALHAGSMYQNVGLYCASAGLANNVLGVHSFKMDLPKNQQVLILQSVGYKK